VVLLISGFVNLRAAEFPEPFNTETRGNPMPAEESARSFRLPPGFRAEVVAGEPTVRQPIAMTMDARGRLWVAENYTYAEAKVGYEMRLRDRIVILEDTQGNGHFDKRTIFWDEAKILTSIEVGYGGVFVLCPPQLLFIPDRNHDDVPDSKAEVLVDGLANPSANLHTFANGLKWGPDGWLWGRVGISAPLRGGIPGTPDTERVALNGGIWRYHPVRKVFEAVAHGTTNPWGLDWDADGEPFFINTVIGHLWHAIPGAHFERMHGQDVNAHSYGFIPQHADHYHFDTGAGWTKSRAAYDGSSFAPGSDGLGGGHAHSGLMIYQGDNWPEVYRGRLFTINLHGRRINQERLERDGSGYVGKHEEDLLSVGDPWFRGLDLFYGPDGGVFISDWSDTGECHDNDGVHRTSGRIYKVTYGEPKPAGSKADLTRLGNSELIPLLYHRNEWFVRQARRVLADRAAAGTDLISVKARLMERFESETNRLGKLHTLWGLIAVQGISRDWLLQRCEDADEHIRSWAVRLLVDDPARLSPRGLKRLETLAGQDASPLVRLYLASALQRLPIERRVLLASALLAHPEDVYDHNLGLMIWYGVEPLVIPFRYNAVTLALASQHPIVRQYIARRFTDEISKSPELLEGLLTAGTDRPDNIKADILRGMSQALKGWKHANAPSTWMAFANSSRHSGDEEIRNLIRNLGFVFGDEQGFAELRKTVLDRSQSAERRREALQLLAESSAPDLRTTLAAVMDDAALRVPSIAVQVQLGEPEAPAQAVDAYPGASSEDRQRLLQGLVSRAGSARELLDAVAQKRVPRTDISAFLARQIAKLNDPALTARLTEVWGAVRPADLNKKAESARHRENLGAERLKAADLPHGRVLFGQVCGSCHQLYGEGGKVGPDLTGSGRAVLDYLLENIVDPSAVVASDYRLALLTLKDGRSVNGILREQTPQTVTVQNPVERITLDRREIESLEISPQSMMPEGLLDGLAPDDRRDLIAYLMHPRQVPLPTAK
jgi:putative membrane-bound dehydrogenase-like protein